MSQFLSQIVDTSSMAFRATLILFFVVVLISIYWYLLPKPIPGDIPYDKVSRRRLLGDLPDLLKNIAVTRNPFDFLTERVQQIQSPIIQIWMKPFSRPIVVISDPRETEDILLRRTKEFDRGQFFKDIFNDNVPYHHIVLPTNEQFKAQRTFIRDAMSPVFLRDVGVPRVHEAAIDLVKLWHLKARIANGRAFKGFPDIKHAVFDAIWAIAIGEQAGGVNTQTAYLSGRQPSLDLNNGPDTVEFPEAPTPPIVGAIDLMIDAIEKVAPSPIPQPYHKFLKLFPTLRGAYATKDKAIDYMLEVSRQRFAGSEKQTKTSALDYYLHRNDQRAEKIGDHLPEKIIRDELLGFLQAVSSSLCPFSLRGKFKKLTHTEQGHETTSTTIAWIVKYLAVYPACQEKLRTALREAFPTTKAPSADAIMQSKIPYLDAFLEECMRLCNTAPAATRTAVVDTEILGHFIPAGTEVYMLFTGPGYLRPALRIPESARSQRVQEHKEKKNGSWDNETCGDFDPERWIETETGEFNPQAGPMHGFSMGIRGCWGRKLAYIEMRIMITFLMLSFEFAGVPEELAGFEQHVRLTNEPRTCYVRLKEL
jgi:hypothetical protein